MNIRISELTAISKKLRKIKCPNHRKTASVEVKDGQIELSNFCCEEFDEKLHHKAKDLLIKQVALNQKEKDKKNVWKR